MAIKFRRPQSLAAIFAFKLVCLAIAFQIIAIVLHRIDFITGKLFFAISGVGFLFAVAAIICAIIAYVSLWRVAAKGGVRATLSIIIALVLFAPFIFVYWQNYPVPKINDVSTDLKNRPHYQELIAIREKQGFVKPKWGEEQVKIHQTAYPNLKPRFYDTSLEETTKAILAIAGKRGWEIINAPNLDEDKLEETAPTQAVEQKLSQEEDEDEEVNEEVSEITIEATWKTLVVGFKNDAVIRLIDDNERTRVDIRSSARLGRLDFRANAKEIWAFFSALDKQILNFSKVKPEQ